jgi:hypothetical protein
MASLLRLSAVVDRSHKTGQTSVELLLRLSSSAQLKCLRIGVRKADFSDAKERLGM